MVKSIRKHLLFSGSSCAETLLWQKQLIPASFYIKGISLLLISVTLHHLSTIPSCISAVGKESSVPEASCCVQWKLYCYSSPSHLTPDNLLLLSVFLSFFFVFVYWPIKTTTANLPGLTHSNPNPSKHTNQVTVSDKQMNHLFWAKGNLVHYRMNA